jgi:hypothetical protein
MLAPFKHYIEASEASKAPQMNNHGIQNSSQMIQAPTMAQTLLVVQTIHANVLAGNAKEPRFIISERFDGTRSKFHGFVQYVNLFLRLQFSL